MEVENLPIEGLKLIKPRVFGDHRGFFIESWNARTFAAAGLDLPFVQDNHSKSIKGTLRGLHFQVNAWQDKLVRCIQGSIYDVALDVRPASPTYGQWKGVVLSSENHHQLLVPKGFAHGFQVISETAEVMYKCTDFYSPQDERGVLWSDPALNIDWPDRAHPVLSDKDRLHPLFQDIVLK